MIDPMIFDRIRKIYNQHKDKLDNENVTQALIEELGEYTRACRIEDGKTPHKTLNESSQIEIIDLIIVAIEAYILRGGKFSDLNHIAHSKLTKWEHNLNNYQSLNNNQQLPYS